jgi:transcriptional regulator with XRE-family HTH domain
MSVYYRRMTASESQESLERVIAQNVRGEMARTGVSHSEMAQALGISQQSMSRKTLGQTRFRASELIVIGRRLKVDPSVFLQVGDRTVPAPVRIDPEDLPEIIRALAEIKSQELGVPVYTPFDRVGGEAA